MRRTTVAAVALAASLWPAIGCAHEQLPWPPPAEDIARINEAAKAKPYLRVQFIEPIPPARGVASAPALSIESIDDARIAFRSTAGTVVTFPSEAVKGVSVRDPRRGALIGTGIGAALGAVVAALPTVGKCVFDNILPDHSSANAPRPSCTRDFDGEDAGVAVAVGALLGAVAGYFIGARRTFDFGRVP
jgi:hypothetical protein